jgi:hypothetical protein
MAKFLLIMILSYKMVILSLANTEKLSADCADELGGEAESGFVGGVDKGLKGFLKFLMVFTCPI